MKIDCSGERYVGRSFRTVLEIKYVCFSLQELVNVIIESYLVVPGSPG